jgi:hypothetical protein
MVGKESGLPSLMLGGKAMASRAEADSEEVNRLTKLLEIHKKNLYRLEEKAAMYGMDAPIYLINQIEHEKGEIQKIEARVQAFSSSSPERRRKGFIEASIGESQVKAAAQIFLSYAREDEEKTSCREKNGHPVSGELSGTLISSWCVCQPTRSEKEVGFRGK